MSTQTLPEIVRKATDIAAVLMENEGELPPDLELKTDLNAIELAEKIDSYGFVQDELEMRAEYARKMSKQWSDFAKSCDKAVDNINKRIFWAITELGETKLAGNQTEYGLKANPPRVVIDDETKVPQKFLVTETITSIDKKGLSAALKAGESIPGARIEQDMRVARKVSAPKKLKKAAN